MDLHEFFLIAHLLLFVYWLGGDMGVYYSSGMVIDPKLSDSARLTAAKIMVNLDLVPRICMTLMLTVGGVLSEKFVPHPMWQTVGMWLMAPVWLAMVLTIHVNEGKPLAKFVGRVDYWFRWLIVIYLLASVGFSFATGRLTEEPWVGAKLAIFAGLVFCGLMIRVYIPDYVKGIHALAGSSVTDESNVNMAKSLNQCRPYVLAIWAGLIIECYLGVVKPGADKTVEVLSSLGPLFGY
jgi:hypothetical protein